MSSGALIAPPDRTSDLSDRLLSREPEEYLDRLENRLMQVRSGSTQSSGGSIKSNSQIIDRSRPSPSISEDSLSSDGSDCSDVDRIAQNVPSSVGREEIARLEGQPLLALATPFAGTQEQINAISASSPIVATLASPNISSSQNSSKSESKQTVPGIADGGKIQFHDVVRIAGGLAYKAKKRKKSKNPSFQPPPEVNGFDTHRKRFIDPFKDGSSPVPPLRTVSESSVDSFVPPDRSTLQPSTSRCSMVSLDGPSPSRARSGMSRASTGSPPPSPAWQSTVQKSRIARRPSGLLSLRRPSMSDSVTGSVMASTIASRSTSPASSIYVPLRVPIARAPAPFYGPTPERVTRVRERRKVAERDAERAKGGWKAWWNNWYYPSDNSAVRKGKMSSAHQHHHDEHHDESEYDRPGEFGEEDSDDGECYHDVLLEHERTKLERRLKKLKSAAAAHHRPRPSQPLNPSSVNRQVDASRWLPQWWGSGSRRAASRLPALPPPKPMRGILRADTSPHLPITPQTPLLHSSLTLLPQYVNDPASAPTPKTEVDVRFGRAPRRWLKLSWWSWKIKTILGTAIRAVKAKFVDLFHVDWDTDSEHYEGWEND